MAADTKPMVQIKERSDYVIIELTMPDGKLYRIQTRGNATFSITSVDGGMAVFPKTSNQIEIETN